MRDKAFPFRCWLLVALERGRKSIMPSDTKAHSDGYQRTVSAIHRVFWPTAETQPTERQMRMAEAYLLRWAVAYLDVLLPHVCRDITYAQDEGIPATLAYWDAIRQRRERRNQ